jgi:SAM-dependent methyltransferase
VACGTGRHIQYLKNDFDCVGVDISDRMLAVARENVPGTRFARASIARAIRFTDILVFSNYVPTVAPATDRLLADC